MSSYDIQEASYMVWLPRNITMLVMIGYVVGLRPSLDIHGGIALTEAVDGTDEWCCIAK